MELQNKLDEIWDCEGMRAILTRLAELEEHAAYPTSAKTALNDERHLRIAAELRRLAELATD